MMVTYLRSAFPSSEILVSEDGSVDGTVDFVSELSKATQRPAVRILSSRRRLGKGSGVRRGVLAAAGSYVIVVDADVPVPLSSIERAVDELGSGADIVLGSRSLPGSRRDEPRVRRFFSRAFRSFVRVLFHFDFDTQCGFKGFRRERAVPLFRALHIDSLAYDVELVSQALEMGLRIVELPVDWRYDWNTSLTFRDIPKMLLDLMRVRLGCCPLWHR